MLSDNKTNKAYCIFNRLCTTTSLTIAVILMSSLSAFCDETICVVFKTKNSAIDNLITNFISNTRLKGYKVMQLDLKSPHNEDLFKRCNFTLNIGYNSVKSSLQKRKRGIYLFIPSPDKYGLLDENENAIKGFSGISVLVDPQMKIDLLAKILPSSSIIGLIYNPENISGQINKIINAGKSHNFSFKKIELKRADDIKQIKNFKGTVDCILLEYDKTVLERATYANILRFSILNKIPLIGISSSMTKSGALMSFHADYQELGKQSADLMDKLIKDELNKGIFYPENVNYTINLNTAKIMKLNIDSAIVSDADQLF